MHKTILFTLFLSSFSIGFSSLQFKKNTRFSSVTIPNYTYLSCLDKGTQPQIQNYIVNYSVDINPGDIFTRTLVESIDSIQEIANGTGSLCGDINGYDFKVSLFQNDSKTFMLRFSCSNTRTADLSLDGKYIGKAFINNDFQSTLRTQVKTWNTILYSWIDPKCDGLILNKN